jgi:hypothetical protein
MPVPPGGTGATFKLGQYRNLQVVRKTADKRSGGVSGELRGGAEAHTRTGLLLAES